MPKSAKKVKVGRFVYWTPRILGIIFVLFLALFSLDVFGNGYGFWETALGLLIHNIPSIVLLILLIVSWKHELVGAITFILAGLAYIILLSTSQNFQWFMLSWSLTISGPAFLIGILFYVGWKRKNKGKSKK